MRVERVAGQPGIGQVVLEPLDVGEPLHPRVHLPHLVVRELVFRLEHRAAVRRLMAGPGWIELKRAMRHSHVVAMIEERERVLEPALAEIAPRADDVGPDVDVHVS